MDQEMMLGSVPPSTYVAVPPSHHSIGKALRRRYPPFQYKRVLRHVVHPVCSHTHTSLPILHKRTPLKQHWALCRYFP